MADDKSKRGAEDRREVAGHEAYEVEHFAKANGITPEQTRALIKQHGNDRATLETAARLLKDANPAARDAGPEFERHVRDAAAKPSS